MKPFVIIRAFVALLFVVVSCMTASAIILNPELFVPAGVIGSGMVFTHPGGVGVSASFTLTYLPEFLFFNHGGNQLTSLRIENQNGVLHDLNNLSLNAMNGYRKKGAMTANNCTVRIADGKINNQFVTITAVTSAVGAINIYAFSDNIGLVPFKSATVSIAALTETEFKDFTALFIPTLATLTDYVSVTYRDGLVSRWELEELTSKSSDFQQVEGCILDNVQGTIQKAIVRTAAITPAYVLSVAR